jgi:hypothetical protein
MKQQIAILTFVTFYNEIVGRTSLRWSGAKADMLEGGVVREAIL